MRQFQTFFPPETEETGYGNNSVKIKKNNTLSLRMENEIIMLELVMEIFQLTTTSLLKLKIFTSVFTSSLE